MKRTAVQPRNHLSGGKSLRLAERLSVPHIAEAAARLLVRETRPRTKACVVWGGSSVMGVAGCETLPATLSQVTDLDAANEGVSAQSSSQVAARQGGRPASFVIVGGQIPPEGTIKVAPLSISPVQEHWPEIEGELGGIAGKLVRLNDKTHEFRRFEPGEPLTSVEPVEFRSASEFAHESKIAIFWTGRGNYLEQDLIVDDTKACVDRLGHDRFLIIGALNAKLPGHIEHDSVVELNAKLEAQFGRHFVDIRKFLIEHEQRRFDARKKRPGEVFELQNLPKRLRADLIHLNDLGNQLLSLVLAARLESMGICEFPHIHSAFDQIALTDEIKAAIATLDESHEGHSASEPTEIEIVQGELIEARAKLVELDERLLSSMKEAATRENELREAASSAGFRASIAEFNHSSALAALEKLTGELDLVRSEIDTQRRISEYSNLVSAAQAVEIEELRSDLHSTQQELGTARRDAQLTALRADHLERAIGSLSNDLQAARATVEVMRSSAETQAATLAAVTERLASELLAAEAVHTEFLARETLLVSRLSEQEEAFAALASERDQIAEAFQDHIGHYDALREELERKNAADDISYELALDLTRRLRAFADRRGTLAVTGNAAEAEAERALRDLSQQLEATKGTVASLVRAVSDLDTAPAAAAIASGAAATA